MIALGFKIAARDPDGAMRGAATSGESFGQRRFIRHRALVFFEPERDGAKVSALLRRQRGDRRRIEAGRKKNADWNIGDEVIANGLAQDRAKNFTVSDRKSVV